jgi:immune inhibitor A
MNTKSSDLKKIIKQLRVSSQDGCDELSVVPPHPDLDVKIRKEINKMRSAKGILADKVTIRNTKSVGLDDGLIYPGTMYPLGRSAGLKRAPLTGTVRIIIVLVNFSDKQIAQPLAHYNDLFFSTGVIPTGSLREYYREVSHNIVDIQGEVVGPYTLGHPQSYYAHNNYGTGSLAPNARTMAQEAAQAANPAVNFANYDNDGDGFVDAYIVIHAGSGAEQTGNTNDIWSHKWVLPSAYDADGKKIYAYLTVPEDGKIGVCCHELGHLLFGFPDLYDTDYSSAGIGNWCLMAGGSWNNNGDTPAHPTAYCKIKQNWVSVINITALGQTLANINDVKSGYEVYRLWKDGGPGSEYFLVENRQKTGFDKYLPGNGLLIYHIDEAITSNSNEAHPMVKLMQADNKNDLENNVNRGDAGDPYPGSTKNRSFNGSSSPNSNSYAGNPTCVSVAEISDPAAVMSALLKVRCIIKKKEVLKDLQKDLKKEIYKEGRKDLMKEKDFNKEIRIDKLSLTDKIRPKEKSEKEIYEKNTDKLMDGRPGGGTLSSLEDRIMELESRINSFIEPFIEKSLRPDLTQGAFINEDDYSSGQENTNEKMTGEEKHLLDTRHI